MLRSNSFAPLVPKTKREKALYAIIVAMCSGGGFYAVDATHRPERPEPRVQATPVIVNVYQGQNIDRHDDGAKAGP
jgi:hypothetical protein